MRAILLDVEGTTTPADFVYKILFPYARDHVEAFLLEHLEAAGVRHDLEGLEREYASDFEQGSNPPPWNADSAGSRIQPVVAYVRWLIERDRKATALKSLQGRIWEAGYKSGELRAEIYPDVPPALSRWHSSEKKIGIFSSGSVLAQMLLFAHTTAGDLTPYIHEYFDTTTGKKTEPESYRRIAGRLGHPARAILFASDAIAELDAAQVAGMQTALCVRPGRLEPDNTRHPVIHTFSEISS